MKLSAEEINYVFNYLKNIDVKYYELQIEFTDHLVLVMEEIWTEEPELTFHQVLFKAEQRFGKNYFKEMEEERTKLLRKEYRGLQFKMFRKQLSFPRIIGSFLLIFSVYRMSFYFNDISLYIRILCSILIFFSAINLLKWFLYKKSIGNKFLALETTFILNNSAISISYLILLNATIFKEIFNQNPLFFLPLCCLWVFGVVFAIIGYTLTSQTVSKIKNQYQFI